MIAATAPAADYNWWAEILGGFLGGALIAAMLIGQVAAWIQRHGCVLPGGAA